MNRRSRRDRICRRSRIYRRSRRSRRSRRKRRRNTQSRSRYHQDSVILSSSKKLCSVVQCSAVILTAVQFTAALQCSAGAVQCNGAHCCTELTWASLHNVFVLLPLEMLSEEKPSNLFLLENIDMKICSIRFFLIKFSMFVIISTSVI